MPSVQDNKSTWDGDYNWKELGDEWSKPWGSTPMKWHGTVMPRIHTHVPAKTIVEIACGHGRWTQYLKDLCERLIVIDLSKECIDSCKRRFAACSHIEYHVNDGKDLSMIPDGSVDFVYSFDSLVHVDASVLQTYIRQLPRLLTANGTAFIHHSNLGEYQSTYANIRRIPKLEGLLNTIGVLDQNLHWRDPGVDAPKVEKFAQENGLHCLSQEIIQWRGSRLYIDCITTLGKNRSGQENRKWRNPHFSAEADNLLQLAKLYDQR